jgi:O-antigen/teichoic acid export membrane protein
MAFPAIRILYGLQWIASVPLAQVLCIVAAIEVAYFLSKEVLIAKGDVKTANYLQAVLQCIRIVGILAVIPFGLLGACWGLVAAAIAGSIWSHHVLSVKIGLTFRQVMRACTPSLKIALFSTAPTYIWIALGETGEHNFLAVFVVLGVIAVTLWLAALRLLGHPLWKELLKVGQRLLKRK